MIEIVKESGFCHGVLAAVTKAKKLANTHGKQIYLYGDLVNNRQVMAGFLRDGLTVAENTAEIPEGATVIIRAHGVPQFVYKELAAKNAKIIDCTCAKVKSIHEIVAEKCAAGFRVIIIGKKNHPEVLGILGWCKNGIVAENESELLSAISDCGENICVVGQTTCGKEWWSCAAKTVTEINPNAQIHNTLCDVTARRIKNAAQTSENSDCMIVVGDKKSANSVELFEACKTHCNNTFFTASAEELAAHTNTIVSCEKIGIAGSASTPAETINEIHDFILFAKFLSRAKTEIEQASDDYINTLTAEKTNPVIHAAIRDLHNQHQNGKRIRGALIKFGEVISGTLSPNPCELFEKSSTKTLTKIALAYEIFATAILIHDDVIDNSETRRGKTTIHASETDTHFGLSRAICIGDYGLFLANKILAEAELPPKILVKVFKLFSEIQLKTLEGELMDVTLPYSPKDPTSEEYDQTVNGIYEYKTAWYTLMGPIQLGAICGGASDELLEILHEITLPLGLAFQIKDDLLGIFASEEKLGKPALSDIVEKKQTTLYGHACKNATPAQREILEKTYGNPSATVADLETMREIFTATGAKAAAEAEISALSRTALTSIEKLDKKHQPILRGLVHYLFGRTY
ncbi:MAG: 4-hydroxy-3-methylbut-2-enyl diphosphate reductase [Defluviitaleaceae bacterium]|nr:4-hydroxy-3-methylbut-2-enyl diphosphate reductase [Defluviitaleaceae bacterium]MCL2264050.1 4-hydroxy-3-methylbut-2-enyl diphosphate reductase [Defluviitaleaceae bacterium]